MKEEKEEKGELVEVGGKRRGVRAKDATRR